MPRSSDPNRCLRSEIEPIPGPGSKAKVSPPVKKRAITKEPKNGDHTPRLMEQAAKEDIVDQMYKWNMGGRKHEDSPITGIVKQYKCK